MTEDEVKDWIEEKDVGDVNYIMEIVRQAKNSEYGAIWHSLKGPVAITKDGEIGWYGIDLPKIQEH